MKKTDINSLIESIDKLESLSKEMERKYTNKDADFKKTKEKFNKIQKRINKKIK